MYKQAMPCLEAKRSVSNLRAASNIGSREYIHFFYAGFEPEYERQQHFWLNLENSAMWVHNVALLWTDA